MTAFDCVVVGGGPAGATAAAVLAGAGRSVLLIDRAGRIKPCGGAIPPRLVDEFDIPAHLIVNRAASARIVAPSRHAVDMPVDPAGTGGYVGMVDRETFDEWLRARAALAGAERRVGTVRAIARDPDGVAVACYTTERGGPEQRVRARCVIGADGARSRVAAAIGDAAPVPCVFAYHEIVDTRGDAAPIDRSRCDVVYEGAISPDFYGWVFPHGDTTSVGVGSGERRTDLRAATTMLRDRAGLADCATLRREAAPIPLRVRRRWDDGRDVIVAGDAAGVVAPASGEGLYYAMVSGRMVAEAVAAFLVSGNPRALRRARRRFLRAHGAVFGALRFMQHVWYHKDARRERFVAMCADRDVQFLTWQAYLHKTLIFGRPWAYARVAWKDLRHVLQSMG